MSFPLSLLSLSLSPTPPTAAPLYDTSQIGQKLSLALVVSVGTGIFPTQDLGSTDPQEFLHFGRHWLKVGPSIKARAKSLITLLTTAVKRKGGYEWVWQVTPLNVI